MNQFNHSSAGWMPFSDAKSVEWPSLLDILLTIVLILILMVTLLVIRHSQILPLLAVKQKQQNFEILLNVYFTKNYPNIRLHTEDKGTTQSIKLSSHVFFLSGSADLDVAGKELVLALGELLATHQGEFTAIEVIGHTDPQPVKQNALFNDNIDLSCLRAAAVVRVFVEQNLLDVRKLSAVGRSNFGNLSDNVTDYEKQRRIDFRLIYS